MNDDIRSFTVYPITLTHSGARVEEERRMTHREVINFMNATNESTGVGIRFALTENNAHERVRQHNIDNGFQVARRFKVCFRHECADYTTTIAVPTSERLYLAGGCDFYIPANADYREMEYVLNLRRKASFKIAKQSISFAEETHFADWLVEESSLIVIDEVGGDDQ
jgi:hypothetical protein